MATPFQRLQAWRKLKVPLTKRVRRLGDWTLKKRTL